MGVFEMIREKIIPLVIFTILLVGCSSKPDLYSINIDVASQKVNGNSWDIMGGSPDIKVLIDKHPLPFLSTCRDTYRCSLNFTSLRDKWYIEVYDMDIESDDLIGKGDCEEGEECDLGLATVLIEG